MLTSAAVATPASYLESPSPLLSSAGSVHLCATEHLISHTLVCTADLQLPRRRLSQLQSATYLTAELERFNSSSA